VADQALLVGVDAYVTHHALKTPVADIRALQKLLQRDGTDQPRWVTSLLEGPDRSRRRVTTTGFWRAVDQSVERAGRGKGHFLLYFAGHGQRSAEGEHQLVLQGDAPDGPDAVIDLKDVISRVHDRDDLKSSTVIVDCCYAGGAGDDVDFHLSRDRAILSSTSADDVASDGQLHSPFATYMLEGLGGVAAGLDGAITLTGLYEYVAKRFGRQDQRPQLSINLADEPLVVRRTTPLIESSDLHDLFPLSADDVIWLTKDHEGPHGSRPYKSGYEPTPQQRIFDRLKDLQIRGLLDTGGVRDLYWVAMNEPDGGPVRLSPLGQWYWHQRQLGWI
jgi:hypothetical protein